MTELDDLFDDILTNVWDDWQCYLEDDVYLLILPINLSVEESGLMSFWEKT